MFSKEFLGEISEAANTVAKRIDELPLYRAENRYVKQCRIAMFYIMEKAKERLDMTESS
jgi:hypothetical protein